ncbi:MAG: SAM-dependent methyltransferase [Nanoarchaeota archaeon]
MTQHTFIIEHLEPELFPWCLIEYKHISKLIGKNSLWFTNIKKKDKNKLEKYGKIFQESIKNLPLSNLCVLDPDGEKTLSPEDSKFSYFVFGGILGDNPPRKRTGPELTKFLPNAEKRNIGKEQFSTDNAVFVTHRILSGTSLNEMQFQNEVEIRKNKIESFILPYKYNLVNGKPYISKELVSFLKKKKGF